MRVIVSAAVGTPLKVTVVDAAEPCPAAALIHAAKLVARAVVVAPVKVDPVVNNWEEDFVYVRPVPSVEKIVILVLLSGVLRKRMKPVAKRSLRTKGSYL